MSKKPDISFGDFDSDTIHTQDFVASDIQSPNAHQSPDVAFPSDYAPLTDYSALPNTYTEPELDPVIQRVIDHGMTQLTEEEKQDIIREHLANKINNPKKPSRQEQIENERQQKLETKKKYQNWAKVLLVLSASILLISLIAIVVTVIYTSLSSGNMSETGIVGAIISFFGEIIRTLLGV